MNDIRYDFGAGRSDPETFPTEALAAAAAAAIRNTAGALTEYPGTLGHPGLRQAMARRESEREGVSVDPDHIVLTNGSMQAVTLTARALAPNPGNVVVTEALTYPGSISAFRDQGLTLAGIPVDEHGMRVDLLEQRVTELIARGNKPAYIYVLTSYQNPTGALMPRRRREALLEFALGNDIPVVEDNCYADVHFDGPVEPSLFAINPDPRVLALGSLSKILAPGFRLGYVLSRPPLLERVLARRHDAGSNTLAAAVAAKFYEHGIDAHAATTNPVLKRKRDALFSALQTHMHDLCAFSRPRGGLFVWLRLPDDIDMQRLAQLAGERGIKYLPGSSFHVEQNEIPNLRLAFGHLADTTITEGVAELAHCVRAARTSNERAHILGAFD